MYESAHLISSSAPPSSANSRWPTTWRPTPPQRDAPLLPRLRRAFRPARALPVRHPRPIAGAPGQGLEAHQRAQRRTPRMAGGWRAHRQRHPACAQPAGTARLLRRRAAAFGRLPLPGAVRGQARAGDRLRQLGLRHRRRRRAPRPLGRYLGTPWLLLPAQVPPRPPHRHLRRRGEAATPAQATHRRRPDPRPHRQAFRLRPARPGLPPLRIPPGGELPGAAPPRPRRHQGAARPGQRRRPPGGVPRRQPGGLRPHPPGHGLQAGLPLHRPRGTELARARRGPSCT